MEGFLLPPLIGDKYRENMEKTLWISDSQTPHFVGDESRHVMILVGYSITNSLL